MSYFKFPSSIGNIQTCRQLLYIEWEVGGGGGGIDCSVWMNLTEHGMLLLCDLHMYSMLHVWEDEFFPGIQML